MARVAGLAIALLMLPLSSPADPRADYLLHCAGCHLTNAAGVPPSVPSLVNTLGRIVTTPEGRDYVVRVPGASQTPLSDAQLAAVMNWVLQTFNKDTLPEDFKPLSAREVGTSRSQVLADPQKMRESLWPDY
jgi:mono/diheme cytochrome c family protein